MNTTNQTTIVAPSMRSTFTAVTSPGTKLTRSAVNPSCPTVRSADHPTVNRENVERLAWMYYKGQEATSNSERFPMALRAFSKPLMRMMIW